MDPFYRWREKVPVRADEGGSKAHNPLIRRFATPSPHRGEGIKPEFRGDTSVRGNDNLS